MFIAVLDEGYLQIHGNQFEGYKVVDFEDGKDYQMKINGQLKNVKIAPIGQFIVDVFNEELQQYLLKGGTVKEVLQYNNDNNISYRKPLIPPVMIDSTFKPPVYELWENISEETIDDSFSNNELPNIAFFDYLDYIPTSFINLNGNIIPVFQIDEDELYKLEYYDIMRFQKKDLNIIRLCSDCGKAFIGKTTAKRCKNCRFEGNKRQIKENRENNSGADMLYSLNDVINKRRQLKFFSTNEKEDLNYSNNYIQRLQEFIKEKKKGMNKAELYDFAIWVKSIDYKYYHDLFTPIYKSGDNDLIEQWNNERYDIWKQENPEQWVKRWYEKVVQYTYKKYTGDKD